MLKKQYRLPAYTKLINNQAYTTPFFSLKIVRNNLNHNRFGFVIGKKIDKRATVRNRIRRIFRSCIEEMFGQISIGYDMLFFPKALILEMQREKLYNQIYNFLKEKNLLKKITGTAEL